LHALDDALDAGPREILTHGILGGKLAGPAGRHPPTWFAVPLVRREAAIVPGTPTALYPTSDAF
jgi:hypothetical protein